MLALSAMASCGGVALHTGQPVSGVDLSYKYRLILYHSYEQETNLYMALLDIEDDAITVTPYATQDSYTVTDGLRPEEAMRRAEAYLSRPGEYEGMDIREIKASSGAVIGYELLPIYPVFGTGRAETPVVNYFSPRGEPGTVKFIARPRIERRPVLMERMN